MRIGTLMTAAAASFLMATGARVSQAEEIVSPWCGEFLPMITKEWIGAPRRRVHFAPKFCNRILVGDRIETIPEAVAVESGGISADVTSTCVDKVCGRPLKPNMLYRAYVFKDAGQLKLNFSVTEHREGPHGNEVNAEDPAQSFVGLVAAEDTGRVCGGMKSLCILSWFYRGHTSIGDWIGPQYGRDIARTCEPKLREVTGPSIKVLTFGINSTFRQAYRVPNIFATGTIQNSEPGKRVEVAVAIEWGETPVRFQAGAPGAVLWTHFRSAVINIGTALSFESDGELPSPLVRDRTYYIAKAVDGDRFSLSESPSGPEIAIGEGGSGKHIAVVKSRRAGPVIASAGAAVSLCQAVATGALGAEEGWIKGTLQMAAPEGGCAVVPDGLIYTSPHHS